MPLDDQNTPQKIDPKTMLKKVTRTLIKKVLCSNFFFSRSKLKTVS